jgi:mono/diheme cytochrome c family protein
MRLRLVGLLAAVVLLAALNVMAARGRERIVTTTTKVVEVDGAAEPADLVGVAAAPAPDDLVRQGRSLFSAKGCASCHVEIGVGPSLAKLKDRAAKTKPGFSAEQYVRESILAPSAFKAAGGSGSGEMPTLPVNAAELNALVAYLLTL